MTVQLQNTSSFKPGILHACMLASHKGIRYALHLFVCFDSPFMCSLYCAIKIRLLEVDVI